jgi:hypothetical protein
LGLIISVMRCRYIQHQILTVLLCVVLVDACCPGAYQEAEQLYWQEAARPDLGLDTPHFMLFSGYLDLARAVEKSNGERWFHGAWYGPVWGRGDCCGAEIFAKKALLASKTQPAVLVV